MTPKQRYDERRRLRAERLLREEQRMARAAVRGDDARDHDAEMTERLDRLMHAFERIADVMELWADQQVSS